MMTPRPEYVHRGPERGAEPNAPRLPNPPRRTFNWPSPGRDVSFSVNDHSGVCRSF